MALYLIVHSPKPESEGIVLPPTRLEALAEVSLDENRSPRWLKTWSPDLHDDRIFTLWEAESADAVRGALEEFGFLCELAAAPLRVREWGPEDVLAANG
jgi:hypothetical protein